jgi:hypothetical protein
MKFAVKFLNKSVFVQYVGECNTVPRPEHF